MKFRERGDDVVVVVSAMSGETNRLTDLAKSIMPEPDVARNGRAAVHRRAGHHRTARHGAAAGRAARPAPTPAARCTSSPTAPTARRASWTSTRHGSSEDLGAGRVVVVAGFQGVDEHGNITTLGRGGSDTTAVALAAALQGRRVPDLYRCGWGLHHRSAGCVRGAPAGARSPSKRCWRWPARAPRCCRSAPWSSPANTMSRLRVLSSFQEGPGTLITLRGRRNGRSR